MHPERERPPLDGALLRLVVAALLHGTALPDEAEDPLPQVFHGSTPRPECPPDLGALAREAHQLVATTSGGAHLHGTLQSVWARVELADGAAVPARILVAGPAPTMRKGQAVAARERLMPIPGEPVSLGDQYRIFGEELAAARGTGAPSTDTISRLLHVVRRWGWALPAHAVDEPLLEHLQVTAAAAAALWQARAQGEGVTDRPLQLVLLDLSGVQRYLFATAHTGAGGVARRLRARSLTLSLLVETLALELLAALDLPIVNLLAASGGHCYLLVPHSAAATRTLEETWARLEGTLHARYGSVLMATLVRRPLGRDDLLSAGAALHDLAAQRGVAKLRPLPFLLRDGERWREDGWLDPARFAGSGACTACGTRPATTRLREDDQEQSVCAGCAADYRLGALLPQARFLAWLRTPLPFSALAAGAPVLPGYQVLVARSVEDIPSSAAAVQQINAFDLPTSRTPVLGRYLAMHVPADGDGMPLDFAAIAARARGAPLLAVVKADVDRLGAIFSWGLRRDEGQGSDSVSRLLALSRTVDTFFAGWVQGLLEDSFPHCYLIYSGGDDVLLVGPWDQVLKALARVQQDFARYTQHSAVTLSAGVVIVRRSTPIADAVRAVDALEALAKEAGPSGGRNQIALFGQALPWSRAAGVLARWERLTALDERAPSAVLHRWRRYADAYLRAPEGAGLRAVTHFAYDFARNKSSVPEVYRQEWHRLLSEALSGDRGAVMAEIAVLSRLVLLSQRTRTD